MGKFKYCGDNAGLFSSQHKDSERRYLNARAQAFPYSPPTETKEK